MSKKVDNFLLHRWNFSSNLIEEKQSCKENEKKKKQFHLLQGEYQLDQ